MTSEPGWLCQIWRALTLRRLRFAWTLPLLLAIPLEDTRPDVPQAEYDRARQLFLHGHLEKSQQEAARGYKHYLNSNPEWSDKFSLLEAEDMLGRGMYKDVLRLMSAHETARADDEDSVRREVIQGLALARLHEFSAAEQQFNQADILCASAAYSACGGISRARGLMSVELGQLAVARKYFSQSLTFSRQNKDRWQEAVALLNLGFVSLQDNHFDEALDWSISAHREAMEIQDEDLAQTSLGNLGWAYFELGDAERALGLFQEAEGDARTLGDLESQIKWLTTAAYVNRNEGDLSHAAENYRQALNIARVIDSRQDIVDILEELSQISIDEGKIDESTTYIDEAEPLIRATGNRLDELDVLFAQGRIAAARREDKRAEDLFETVRHDPASQTSMKLGAGHELARLYELEGDAAAADRIYRATLAAFEAARSELKKEESKLPFLANATRIYDDYIHFLVSKGRPEEALVAADRSRARTLAQGLGLAKTSAASSSSPDPAALALRTGSTLLFYWLGEKQSYLWAITPGKISIFPLPDKAVIAPVIDRYRRAIEGPGDPIESDNEDGRSLYEMLVAPAKALIRKDAQVVLLADGPLSKLNFETLIAPAASPDGHLSHYWIEDVTLVSAPSLLMLANQRAVENNRSLLMLGDAVSEDPAYPGLHKAADEMRQIGRHFRPGEQTVFSRALATPAVYLASAPERYGFIHFVTHAVASSTDPLDSAILLSRNSPSDHSFKLYARQILAQPIRARLVTISACYGSGMRTYAGEGLVGLSWAFLRAGAHNVIGALWEASDETTPVLMDSLYQGLGQGLSPAAALRNAKLGLLHSQTSLRKPYFWASFQLYAGL